MASNLENAIFGGLLLLPVFAIAVRIYGSQTAWLTAVLLALFPPLTVSVLYWGSMSEPPFLFLLFSALALFLAALEDQRFWMFSAAGAVLGLAYLTRDEAIAFCGALSIFALMWLWTEAKSLPLKTSCAVALFALSFLLVAAPYLWYLHLHTGQWMISGKLQMTWRAGGYRDEGKTTQDQLYFGLDSSGAEVNWLSSERFQGSVLSNVIAHPSVLLHRVLRTAGSLKENFFTDEFWWGSFPGNSGPVQTTLESAAFEIRSVSAHHYCRTLGGVFTIWILNTVLCSCLSDSPHVDGEGSTGAGTVVAGNGHRGGWSILFQPICSRWLGLVPGRNGRRGPVLTIPVTAERAISIMHFGDEEAGRWLKTHIPIDAKIMAQDVAVAVYSGRRWVPSPNTDWARFMKYATAHGAQYLVVRDWKLEQSRPELASVVRSGAPELELIFTFEDIHLPQKVTTFVYRLVKPHE